MCQHALAPTTLSVSGVAHLAGIGGAGALLMAAMLDRLMHHATVVQIGGDSYRLRDKKKGGVMPKVKTEPA